VPEEELSFVVEDEPDVFPAEEEEFSCKLLLLSGLLISPRELLDNVISLELLESSVLSSPPVPLSPPQAARESANTAAPKSVLIFVEKRFINSFE
jgi:hypothetical protein